MTRIRFVLVILVAVCLAGTAARTQEPSLRVLAVSAANEPASGIRPAGLLYAAELAGAPAPQKRPGR